MYTLKVENARGDLLPLTGNPDYTVYKIDGLNPPKATINSSVNTTMDGSTINSVRLENRNIVIYMTIEGDVEANRIELYKYFPIKGTVRLYYENSSRNVFIDGTVESIECDMFAKKQIAQISILCPKPYFKELDYLISNLSAVTNCFEFPFAIEKDGIEFSTLVESVRKTIVNEGDVDTGVIIELYANGTVVNPVIYDVVNQTHMALKITMKASDKIVINTNAGEKSITLTRDGVTSNLLGSMVRDSKWFILSAGENVFTCECEDGLSSLEIIFTTNKLYGGV